MTVIGDLVFPGETFVLKETINNVSELDIEIERLVAHSEDGLVPYFRISAENLDEIEQLLRDDSTVAELKRLEDTAKERFYRAHWVKGVDELMTILRDTQGAAPSATFHDGQWEVRFIFSNRDDLSDFYDRCRETLEFDVQLVRIFNPSNPATYGEYGLTQEQRDALLVALEAGYFEVPKQAHLQDLAEALDISTQAVSQRLRRGYTNLITSTIGTHETGKSS